ncbi:MAG: hypothetical protein PHT59_04115 [Candidatus Omnitrophica bacterium]|nr:hypothetical protein [Candidatus Omnitrophota bacterium]
MFHSKRVGFFVAILATGIFSASAGAQEGPEFYPEMGQSITVTGIVSPIKMSSRTAHPWNETAITAEDGSVYILTGSKIKDIPQGAGTKMIVAGKLKPKMQAGGKWFKTLQIEQISRPGPAEQPARQQGLVRVTGRLITQGDGQDEWLVLHARNGQLYRITGDLAKTLGGVLSTRGQKNLVTVAGFPDDRSLAPCSSSSTYEYNDKGEQVLKTEVRCLQYFDLNCVELIENTVSDEEMAPALRDKAAEDQFRSTMPRANPVTAIVGEIYGIIESVQLRGPVKTVTVRNRDTASSLKKISLILEPQTRIVRKIGFAEPIGLSPNALEAGKEVTVVYARDERKTVASFITITKE